LNDTIQIQSALRMNPPLQTIMSDNGSKDFRYEDVIHASNYYACVSVQEKLKRALTRTTEEILCCCLRRRSSAAAFACACWSRRSSDAFAFACACCLRRRSSAHAFVCASFSSETIWSRSGNCDLTKEENVHP
jgi:hypothetical protein